MSVTGNDFIPERTGFPVGDVTAFPLGGLKYRGDKRNVYPLAVA